MPTSEKNITILAIESSCDDTSAAVLRDGILLSNVTDGQVLVLHDMLGLNQGFKPKFLRHFAQLGEAVKNAVGEYIDAVKQTTFPNDAESY